MIQRRTSINPMMDIPSFTRRDATPCFYFSFVHYSQRNDDIVIESLQSLANPLLVFCVGMTNNELIWKRLTCNHHYGLSLFSCNY